jgi:hypothetical protein
VAAVLRRALSHAREERRATALALGLRDALGE